VQEGTFLSVVIPAYNEAGRIVSTLRRVTEYLTAQSYTWEVIVVDDGSTDRTAALVEEHIERHKGFRLLRVSHGGKGWAVKNGMLAAAGQYRFMADADLAMSIEQLSKFLPPEGSDCDIAIGSRESPGSLRVGEPRLRRFIGRAYNILIRLLLVPGLQDTQCGFKCYKGQVAQDLFTLQRIPGWGFDMEVLFLARKARFSICEVSIEWHYQSQSKVKPFRDSIKMLVEIIKVRWYSISGVYHLSRGG